MRCRGGKGRGEQAGRVPLGYGTLVSNVVGGCGDDANAMGRGERGRGRGRSGGW